jgi:type VI secretion system protein ImpH
MEADSGQPTTGVTERMAAQPFGFDFYRALRLIESEAKTSPRLGTSLHAREDPVRLGQSPSLAFAPSTLENVQTNASGPARINVNFMGLFGPNGPLPLHITEYAHERQYSQRDPAMVAFLDVFHHRALSLFYRAWAVNQKAVDGDRPDESRFATYIGTLLGIGTEHLRGRDILPDNAPLYYSGRLVSQTRNAEGLEAIIRDFFGLPASVQTFHGQWLDLPPTAQCQLGASPETGLLGSTALMGARFWECQLKFRIRIGPMSLNDLHRMLPIGDAFARLKCWVMHYCGHQFFWDAQLVLKKEDVPETQLGATGILGWTTWLKSKPFESDAQDLVVNGDS